MLRIVHAYAWVFAWVYTLGRLTEAYPIGVVGALTAAVLLTAGVYLPVRVVRRETPDLSGDLAGSLAVTLGGAIFSFLLLGAMSVLGYWDNRPKGATTFNLILAVALLHLLGGVCIRISERFSGLFPDEPD